MAEPSKENARLAQRLISIGEVLRDGAKPAAKTNGHTENYTEAFWQTPQGKIAKRYFEALIKAVGRELSRLEQEIAELRSRPTMKYCGVWDDQKVYIVGDFVTDGGSLWHCSDANCGVRPGSSDAWQLAVKKGRDGRDGKGVR